MQSYEKLPSLSEANMSTELSTEIINELNSLSVESQLRVLQFIRALKPVRPGMSGTTLRQFVGIMSDADAQEMKDAIRSGCEKVDIDEW